jgi:hypothetical protein
MYVPKGHWGSWGNTSCDTTWKSCHESEKRRATTHRDLYVVSFLVASFLSFFLYYAGIIACFCVYGMYVLCWPRLALLVCVVHVHPREVKDT